MNRELPFDFEIPMEVFEKSNAGKGKQRRIGGIVSLETEDLQKEKVLQRGLNFTPFLSGGWFNNNHSKSVEGVLGHPESVKVFQRGEKLPNGDIAPATGSWVEGYLLDTQSASKIWELAKALQKTNRKLGFSLEGSIRKRIDGGRTIAQADIRNIAITHCPVHSDTRLQILAKSLSAAEQTEDDEDKEKSVEKTLGMGTATGATPSGPQTGMGAGQVLTPESLEGKAKKKKKGAKSKKIKKSLTTDQIRKRVKSRFPSITEKQITKFIDLAMQQKLDNTL